MHLYSIAAVVGVNVLAVAASIPKPPGIPAVNDAKLTTRAGVPPYNTVYYFDQLIDHDNPSKGTFQQRYWHTAEYYEDGKSLNFTF